MLAASPWLVAAQQPGSTDPTVLDDVEAAFSRIETRGTHVTACASGLIPKPRTGQALPISFLACGITFKAFNGCRSPATWRSRGPTGTRRISSSSVLLRTKSCGCDGEVVARIELDDVLGHAGGLSMLGSILAVPLYGGSPRSAKVVFYDLAEPEAPRRLPVEIARPGRKATATALTRLPNGHYLVAVLAAWDRLPRRR